MKKKVILLLSIGIFITGCETNTQSYDESYDGKPAQTADELTSENITNDDEEIEDENFLYINENTEIEDAIGVGEKYIVHDNSTGLKGIYDFSTDSFVAETVFEEIGYLSDGLICVKKDGYYGYINEKGDKAIGCIYQEVHDFHNGYAIVKNNDLFGVIDKSGTEIIKTMYEEVWSVDDYFVVGEYYPSSGNGGTSAHYEHGLCDNSGNLIVDIGRYENFFVKDNLIYAITDIVYAGSAFAHIKQFESPVWCKVFDREGNALIGAGTDHPDIIYVTEEIYGMTIAYCEKEIMVPMVVGEKKQDVNWYNFVDDSLNLISDKQYKEVQFYNEYGYTLAVEVEGNLNTVDTQKHVFVIDNNVSEICELPNIYGEYESLFYEETNGYFVGGHVVVDGIVFLLDLQTQGFIEVGSYMFAYGTDCTIVSDKDTGLYGLYDKNNLALDCIYNDIWYDGTEFVAIRGAEEERYQSLK